jgi:SAM-dependent methyltransferase
LTPAAAPAAESIEAAAGRSPLREGPPASELADMDELRFREEIEEYPDPPADVVRFIESKELPRRLEYALTQAGIEPRGVIVDLGAGTCWLAATLARLSQVERVIAIELSRRRLELLAPVALAHLAAPPEKVERVVADFFAHGLGGEIADMVFIDSAFHHAADPVALARAAFGLLKPGGLFVLVREPTLSLLRRRRDHGVEDEHGAFEREYRAGGYLRHLRAAGFEASKHRASGGWRTRRGRLSLRPPLMWLNGVLFSEYTYVGRKRADVLPTTAGA